MLSWNNKTIELHVELQSHSFYAVPKVVAHGGLASFSNAPKRCIGCVSCSLRVCGRLPHNIQLVAIVFVYMWGWSLSRFY